MQGVLQGLPQQQPQDPQAFANAVQAVLNANNPQPAAGAAAPAAVPFSLAPALANNNVIDYTTTAGAKIFSKATSALPTTFSLESPNTRVLLEQLTLRSATYGWSNILDVPTGPANNQVTRSMLTNHAQITKEECQAAVSNYIGAQGRAAQNDFQLLSTLYESVDADTTTKMANESAQYHTMVNGNSQPSGLLYLKHLLSKAVIDSRAVGSHVRSNLAKLPDYMDNIAKDNVLTFNHYVREQVTLLAARGETSTDLMDNLFSGYLTCKDQRFVSYIERVQQDWQDDPTSSLPKQKATTRPVYWPTTGRA